MTWHPGPEATTALAANFIDSFSGVRLGFIADSSSPVTLIGLCRTKWQLSELPQKARRTKMARNIDLDSGRPFIKINRLATARKE